MMNEEELMQKFSDIFQDTFWASQIDHYIKAGPRSIFIFPNSGERLFFIWNGEHNWVLSSVPE